MRDNDENVDEPEEYAVTKRDLHRFIKHDLQGEIESDPRFEGCLLNEYTLQAIIYDKLTRFVGDSWLVLVGESVPGTEFKADLVLFKRTRDGDIDIRYGVVAVEVKPNGQIEGLERDLRKLGTYLRRTDVNFCTLIYASPRTMYDARIDELAAEFDARRIVTIRLHPK